MSCQTCAGCFTGHGCHGSSVPPAAAARHESRFHALLQQAASEPEDGQHDHTIPTIVSELANNVYASQMVLLTVYQTCGRDAFITLAQQCHDRQVTGSHIAWAFEYCDSNVDRFLAVLKQPTPEFVQHLDDQAEIHEVMNGLSTGAMGRAARV